MSFSARSSFNTLEEKVAQALARSCMDTKLWIYKRSCCYTRSHLSEARGHWFTLACRCHQTFQPMCVGSKTAVLFIVDLRSVDRCPQVTLPWDFPRQNQHVYCFHRFYHVLIKSRVLFDCAFLQQRYWDMVRVYYPGRPSARKTIQLVGMANRTLQMWSFG